MKSSKQNSISVEVYQVSEIVQAVVRDAPIGTNLALYQGLMTMMSGEMLASRGALIPALDSVGMDQAETMRTWQGLAHGSWEINDLLEKLTDKIETEGRWVSTEVGGYRIKALDTVGYYRPRLQNCETKHYNSTADKALPAINLGQLAMVGQVDEQKVTVPCAIVRAEGEIQSEEDLMAALCREAASHLTEEDVTTADRKFAPLTMVKSGITQVVLRRPKNMTLQRNTPAPYQGKGRRPIYGELIRPLARHHKTHVIPASAPDAEYAWQEPQADGSSITITAKLWRDVIPTPQKDWTDEDFDLIHSVTWTAFVIEHPKFDIPMIVLSTLDLSAPQVNQVVKARWGIEQPPLVAKQLLGLHRQFVWSPQMRFRYPELSLLAAGILTYAAACVSAPTPTGWWDRHPKPTAGRLRRLLIKVDWRKLPLHPRLREKNAVTAHLPKGRPSLAHRANQIQPLLA